MLDIPVPKVVDDVSEVGRCLTAPRYKYEEHFLSAGLFLGLPKFSAIYNIHSTLSSSRLNIYTPYKIN